MSSLKKLLQKKGYIRIPLKRTKTNHLSVKALVNGIEGRFIVDTGASNSCIGVDYIEEFNLVTTESETKAAGAGATDMETQLSEYNSVSIADWMYDEVHLVVFDLSHVNTALTQHKAKKVKGIIGADILQLGKAVIQYKEPAMYLKKPKKITV